MKWSRDDNKPKLRANPLYWLTIGIAVGYLLTTIVVWRMGI